MKIAHVSDFYLPRLGGIEVHIADLVAHQRAQGHHVQVITSTPGGAEEGVFRAAAGLYPAHALHPTAVRRAIRAVAGVDVVHAHAGLGSPLAFLAARQAAQAGLPTVVTVHSVLAGYRAVFAGVDRLGGWSKLPIVWTAVSECAAQPLRQALSGAAVLVLPNGIDQTLWQRSYARERPREGNTEQVVIAAVMRLTARKRPMPLLAMFRQARSIVGGLVDLRLQVAGDGPQRHRMNGYLRRHRLEDSVTLLGRLDRPAVHRLLEQADLFLAPANLESFGIAALEARCAGLPVIAKTSGGIGEFIRDGREGALCASDTAMVRALARLAVDTPFRRTIAQHNHASRCELDWESIIGKTDALYRLAKERHAACGPATADR